MSTWLKISLSVVIMFSVGLIAIAILQTNGYSLPGLSAAIGFIAGLLFFIFAPPPPNSQKNSKPVEPASSTTNQSSVDSQPVASPPVDVEFDKSSISSNSETPASSPPKQPSIKTQPADPPVEAKIDNSDDEPVWSEEFSILYEYDLIVKECHDELWDIDFKLTAQFREEVVSDRNMAQSICERLKAEHEKTINPYSSEELNKGLSDARLLGENAANEFVRVVEVMGEDVDVGSITKRLKEKHKPVVNDEVLAEIAELNAWGITRNGEAFEYNGTDYPSHEDALESAQTQLNSILNKAGIGDIRHLLKQHGFHLETRGHNKYIVSLDFKESKTMSLPELNQYIIEKIGPKNIR